MPPPLPSVTSIPNYNNHYHNGAYFNGHYGARGYRSGGFAYAFPTTITRWMIPALTATTT